MVFAMALAACSPSSETFTTLQPETTTATAGTTASSTTSSPETTTTTVWTQPDHVIAIDGGEFVDTRTGESFIVRGANYLTRVPAGGGYQDRTLSPAVFDPDATSADFAALAERGYTTIRVFLDTCNGGTSCVGNPNGDGLNPLYLDTIVEFMELARDHGLFILFTSNDLPDQGGYWRISDEDNVEGVFPGYRNSHYLTASGERAAVTYWRDLLAGLVERRAPLDAVLAWSILNEEWMFTTEPPLSLDGGEVATKTGTYDMADPAEKRQMVVDGTRSYFASVAEEIKRHDPTALVTSGFFAPQFPNPTDIGGSWYVDTAPLVADSALDFFDFHAYPGEDIPFDQIAENFGLPSGKPVILGEYGAFIDRYPDIGGAAIATQAWVAQSCEAGFDGWLYWEYAPASLSVGDATWALTAEDGLLLDALSVVEQPDPCVPTLVDPNLALGAAVTASRALADEPASAAVDGNPATQWARAPNHGSGSKSTSVRAPRSVRSNSSLHSFRKAERSMWFRSTAWMFRRSME